MAGHESPIDAAEAATPPDSGEQQLTAAFARLSQTYELILHATSEGVFGLDSEGRINYANAAAARMLGWQVEDLLGQTVDAVVAGEGSAASAAAAPWRPPLASEQARRRCEFWARGRARGATALTPLTVEYSLALIEEDEHCEGAVLVFSDVSERDRAERALQESLAALRESNERLSATRAELLQSEKMAAIGQLAAGVAHEINTPIGYVNANISTLGRYLNDLQGLLAVYEQALPKLGADAAVLASVAAARQRCDLDFLREDSPALLRETQGGIATVARIVRELMDFSASGEHGEWQSSDVHDLIEAGLAAASSRIGSTAAIGIVREYGELPPIFCLAPAIRQVFANLLLNALQAVARDGRIVIRSVRQGADQVRVEIEDNGVGIAAADLGRVFNPFFTTRPVGSGTGMGLSVADTIVRRHGGRIEIVSECGSAGGRGTKVSVTLPLRPDGTAQA